MDPLDLIVGRGSSADRDLSVDHDRYLYGGTLGGSDRLETMAGEARILSAPLGRDELATLAADTFGDMLKIVLDVERGLAAAGGMLHAEAESLLIEDGSAQSHIWGANYFPARPAGSRLEFTALINIRPSDRNPDQRVLDPLIREKIAELTRRWIGEL